MTAGRVSIIIPARNERYLVPTVQDLLRHASDSIEVIAVLDGYWPDPPLPNDPRVKILHRGDAQGMRPAINAAVQMSTGEFLLKCDAHTSWAEGYDHQLKADYLEDNWILTPRRYALDAENWCWDTSNAKYPVDYESLSWPWNHPNHPLTGFHGLPWTSRREARKDILLDRDLSAQGSAWFTSRNHWDRIGPMRMDLYGEFFAESQEVGLATQMAGGEMMRTKRTWYAHWRKSKAGRGYALGPNAHKRGAQIMLRQCLMNQWPNQTRTLEQLIQGFWPVPGWPQDWEKQLADKRSELCEVAA